MMLTMKSTQFSRLRLRVAALRQHTPTAFSLWYVKRLPSAKLTRRRRELSAQIALFEAEKKDQLAQAGAGTPNDDDWKHLGLLDAGLTWRTTLLRIVERECGHRAKDVRNPRRAAKVGPKRL